MTSNRTMRSPMGGLILIAVGMIALFIQVTGLSFLGAYWPLFIIGAGAIFFMGMVAGGRSTAGLAIPGSILTTIGSLLLFQSLTDRWYTWSYAWGLIIVAVGIGLFIKGVWGEDEQARRIGLILAGSGGLVFLIFASFFEVGFGFFGFSPAPGIVFSVAMIGLGLYLVIKRTLITSQTTTEPPIAGLMEEKPANGDQL